MRQAIVPTVLAGALACLTACGGDDPRGHEAARAWSDAVWQPSKETFDGAAAATAERLRAAGADATADDLFLAGSAALLADDAERGLELLDRVGRGAPGRPGFLLFQGFWFSTQHRREDAERSFGAALAALAARRDDEPFAPEVEFLGHLFRGQERYFQKEYTGAVADLTRAEELAAAHGNGVNRVVVRFLADCHAHQQEYGPAEEVMRRAIAGDPDFAAHHFQLGMVLAAQARTSEAAAAYERTLELAPGDPRPRLKLAEIHRRDGDLPGMRRQLDALLEAVAEGDLGGELSSALGSYWLERGREIASDGDDAGAAEAYARSREHLLEAVATNPLCTRAYTLLVQVAALAGAPEDEVRRYKERLDELEHAKSGTPAASDPNRTFC